MGVLLSSSVGKDLYSLCRSLSSLILGLSPSLSDGDSTKLDGLIFASTKLDFFICLIAFKRSRTSTNLILSSNHVVIVYFNQSSVTNPHLSEVSDVHFR